MIFLTAPIVFSTAISNYLKQTAPSLAIAVNPFHSDALVADLVARLSEPGAKDNLEQIRSAAHKITKYAPTDARGYSLIGETYLVAGEHDRAKKQFDTALRFSKTEVNALRRSLGYLLQDGDFTGALDRLDLVSRRWPQRFEQFAGSIPTILSEPEGYERAVEVLSQNPPWRRRFFSSLNRDEQTLDLAYRLHLDLHGATGEISPIETGQTMRALIRVKHYNLAHRLFLFTQTQEDEPNSGYVFNSAFSVQPSGRPFDWTLREDAAAKVHWSGGTGNQSGKLRIRFFGKPVKTVGVSQYLRLPPGDFSLSVSFSGQRLVLSKGLYLVLRCIDPRSEVVRVPFPEASLVNDVLTESFRVNEGECGLFQILMDTDLVAESFRYRYEGVLDLLEVRIDRSES